MKFALLTLVLLGQTTSRNSTNETLVGTTATALNRKPNRKAVEILNLGSNPIWCAVGQSALAVVGRSRRIAAGGGTWSLDLPDNVDIWCVAETAAQTSGAATVTTEI